MEKLIICQNGHSDYKIVFSYTSDASALSASLLQSVIYRATGVSLPLVSDKATPFGENEIIVGRTNRENVTYPYDRIGLRELGFVCGVYGSNLVLDGGAFTAEKFAVLKFLETFLGYDHTHPYKKLAHTDTLAVPADYYYENSPRSWVERIPDPIGDEAQIYMVPSSILPSGNNAYRGMGYVIKTRNGRLLVIDGGQATDAPTVIALLKKLSGEEVPTVDGWFITHIHADHVDAFLTIGEKFSDQVNVKCLYHSLPSHEFCEHWGEKSRRERFDALIDNFCSFKRVTRGESFDFDGVHVDVIFNVDDEFEKYLTDRIEASRSSINKPCGDAINNSDTLYKFTAEGHSLLILGDYMHFGEEYLYDYHPEVIPTLKADMVQCAHHGSNFMGQRIYSYIGARVALWSTTLDSWNYKDAFINFLRERLYEIGLFKNHIGGEGIIPIPFDLSHITPEDSACYDHELSAMEMLKGERRGLILSRKYNYVIYPEANKIAFKLCAYSDSAKLTVAQNGTAIAPADGVYTLDAPVGTSFTVTVETAGNEPTVYTFACAARAERKTLLHLDMKTMLSDGTVADASGNGYNAEAKNISLIHEDGRAAIRPSAESYLCVKDAKELCMGEDDFTISAWVKPDRLDLTATVCYWGEDNIGGNTRYHLRLHRELPEAGCPWFFIGSSAIKREYAVKGGTPLNIGEWQHIVVTSSRLNQKLFINGKFASERSFMCSMDMTAKNELFIGVSSRGECPFNGAIGDFRILNHALDDAEIEALYNETK